MTVFEMPLVRYLRNTKQIPRLTERQKCYMKWFAKLTSRNVSPS
jgi:hypothetical protein